MYRRPNSQRTTTNLVKTLPDSFHGIPPTDGGGKSSTNTNIVDGNNPRSLPKQTRTNTNLYKN
jgi:hypothetical protein